MLLILDMKGVSDGNKTQCKNWKFRRCGDEKIDGGTRFFGEGETW
jgi:hypothetical protein